MRLIDADALLNRMQEDPLFYFVERYGVSGVINAEPTVDAVPVRHGKWLDRNGEYQFGTCSVCGDRWGSIGVMKYCPSCGAKMDAEREEECG